MPYKDPTMAKRAAHARYVRLRDEKWKHPDGSWKKQDAASRRIWQRAYYAENKEHIKKLAKDRRRREVSDRPNQCIICLVSDVATVFDHCHATGMFRGYICSSCNLAIGHARDNPKTLQRMVKYLTGELRNG